MKTSGVRRSALVYKGADPAGKVEMPAVISSSDRRSQLRQLGIPDLREARVPIKGMACRDSSALQRACNAR